MRSFLFAAILTLAAAGMSQAQCAACDAASGSGRAMMTIRYQESRMSSFGGGYSGSMYGRSGMSSGYGRSRAGFFQRGPVRRVLFAPFRR